MPLDRSFFRVACPGYLLIRPWHRPSFEPRVGPRAVGRSGPCFRRFEPRVDPRAVGRHRPCFGRSVATGTLGALSLALVLLPPTRALGQPTQAEPLPSASPKPTPQLSTPQDSAPAPQPSAPQSPSPAADPGQAQPSTTTNAPESEATPQISSGLTSLPSKSDEQAPAKPAATTPKLDPSISAQEVRARVLNDRYRPTSNPVRFGGLVRVGLYASTKGKRTAAARGLGIELEPGINMNYLSVSLALAAHMGRYYHLPLQGQFHPELNSFEQKDHPGYRSPFTASTGLRVGIGRLALQGHGFIEPRIGWDISMSSLEKVGIYRPEKIAWSHGPALRLDVGFLSQSISSSAKLRKIYGASLGWNMLAGGLNIKMPTAHGIFLGLFAQLN